MYFITVGPIPIDSNFFIAAGSALGQLSLVTGSLMAFLALCSSSGAEAWLARSLRCLGADDLFVTAASVWIVHSGSIG